MKRSRSDFEEATNGEAIVKDEEEEEVKPPPSLLSAQSSSTAGRQKCPYLDTINRAYLDFDFEKVCSISLSNLNVYCCLVCGKYFQGRGRNTYAHTHSVQVSHHVFMNLHNGKIYCLPDLYEVVDSSLDDIKRALFPSFTKADIARLNSNKTLIRDVHGVTYLPGFVGLNNLKNTDYVNVGLQALAQVVPIRNYFLQPTLYDGKTKSNLVLRFGEVMRKLWSRDNFKSTVSPHDFLQEVSLASKKKFVIGKQAECIEFISWLLNNLHMGLGGTKKPRSSVIFEAFQGEVKVLTLTKKKKPMTLGANGEGQAKGPTPMDEDQDEEEEWTPEETKSPFLFLTLDIPATPLFKDSQGGDIIPQVPLFNVLEKYNGVKLTDVVRSGVHQRKRYWVTKLPRYLILHLARFTRNNFFVEKNPTIVNVPIKNLELKDYYFPEHPLPKPEEIEAMSVKELKALLKANGASATDAVEKADLVSKVKAVVEELGGTKYDLVANIVHDSPPGQDKKETHRDQVPPGTHRVHVLNRASDQWYEIQDLHVTETMPQLINISESYILIYEKKGQKGRDYLD